MSMDNIRSFFELLDGYLIGDLEVMVNEIPPREYGGLGYPIMQTILSGMELLGMVLSGGKRDENAFYYFWSAQFAVDNPQYDDLRLRKIFRCSIRNGIAHYFLVKFGVWLSKADEANLTRTAGKGLNIDVKCFYRDFRKTYERVKKDLLSGSATGALISNFDRGYERLVKDLKAAKFDVDEYVRNIPEAPKKLAGPTGLTSEHVKSATGVDLDLLDPVT